MNKPRLSGLLFTVAALAGSLAAIGDLVADQYVSAAAYGLVAAACATAAARLLS